MAREKRPVAKGARFSDRERERLERAVEIVPDITEADIIRAGVKLELDRLATIYPKIDKGARNGKV